MVSAHDVLINTVGLHISIMVIWAGTVAIGYLQWFVLLPRVRRRWFEHVDGVTGRPGRGLGFGLELRSRPSDGWCSNNGVRGDRLQASSRDDHGPLCRNRRVFGIFERVRDGGGRQDRAGRQGVERARGLARLVWCACRERDADWVGST